MESGLGRLCTREVDLVRIVQCGEYAFTWILNVFLLLLTFVLDYEFTKVAMAVFHTQITYRNLKGEYDNDAELYGSHPP